MEQFTRERDWPRYRGQQILNWIYQKGITRIEEMSNLSLSDRNLLQDRAWISDLQLIRHQQGVDGTEKFLFRLSDQQEIESVLIPDDERHTLCISTQAGCTLDCGFCLTGTMGLLRNLKTHEIVDQVLWVQRRIKPKLSLTNVVLMGMGEPLANYREVIEALQRMTHPMLMGFPPRRITVSTAGLVPQMKKLGQSGLNVNLAVSLNATTNSQRDRIMPEINRQYPMEKLLEACRSYPLPPRRRLFMEYVLLRGLNDTASDALRLLRLLKGIRCKVNLIPYNDYPGSSFRRPSDEVLLRFHQQLLKGGLLVFTRKSRGRDILAACGQLRTDSATVDNKTAVLLR